MALTGKQALFVEEYLKCWNKTEAARRAGYDGNDVTLGAIGYENFKKPQIEEAIKQRLAEVAMSSDEVLKRLAEHARGNMGDFWRIPANGSPVLDLTSDKAKPQLHLIKKMKVKTTTKLLVGDGESLPEDEDPILLAQLVTTEIDFELYDAQAALEKLGKHHNLFAEKEKPPPPPVEVDINVSELLRSRISGITVRLRAGSNAEGTGADSGG